MSKELYSNAAISFIGATPVGASDTSIILTDSSMFPATGNFTVKCGDEIILVTANNTGTKTLTVTRAQEGTTGATHATGSPLWSCLTDGALRRLVIASNAGTIVGARRQLNFIQGANTTLTMTDDPTNDKVDITIAGQAGGGGGGNPFEAAPTIPLVANFTWVNQSNATATNSATGIRLFDIAHNSVNQRWLMSNTTFAANGSWQIVARVWKLSWDQGSANDCGLMIAEADNAKWESFSLIGNTIIFYRGTGGPTAAGTAATTHTLPITDTGGAWWLRISQHDGYRWWEISRDGVNWMLAQKYYDYLAPAAAVKAGFYANANNNWNCDCLMVVSHCSVGAYP